MHHPLGPDRRRRALELLARDPHEPVDEEPLGGDWAPVTRLRFRDGTGPVVVKTRRVDGAGWGGPHHLRRELVGLELLAGAAVAPAVVAADEAAGVVVTSDLGEGPTLEQVLLGDDADAAAEALVALGTVVGRLHAATRDVEERHRAALAALGTDAGRDRLGLWPGPERWPDVVDATRELGLPDAATAADDVAEVEAELRAPGAAGALVHLDLNPKNVVLAGGSARLVDFEGSTFGHTGIDLCFLHYPFPNYSAHWAVLPDEVVDAADDAYRDAAGVTDRAEHRRTLAVGAADVFTIRVQRLPVLAAGGQAAHDSWRRRAQLVQQIEVLVRLTEEAGILPGLRRFAAELAAAMAGRWPDATDPPPPRYPAFAGGA